MNVVRKPVWDESFLKLSPSEISQPFQQNEEVDLRKVINTLWQGRWLVIAATIVIAILSYSYAQSRTPMWSAYAQVSIPNASDMLGYRKQVQAYLPIFSYAAEGDVPELQKLINPNHLYSQFIQVFNSADTQEQFKDSLGVNQVWIGTIRATPVKNSQREYQFFIKQGVDINAISLPDYQLRLQSSSAGKSETLLSSYIKFCLERTQRVASDNLNALVNAKHKEMLQRQKMLEIQADGRIKAEISQTQTQLDIALSVGGNVQRYQNTIALLKRLTNYRLVSPELNAIDAKLDVMTQLANSPFENFKSVHSLNDALAVNSQDRVSSWLIFVLGGMLGMIASCILLLVKAALKH